MKIRKITKKWLRDNNVCESGYEWFCNQKETNTRKVLLKLIGEDRSNDANWVIVRMMTRRQKVQYAFFAAEHVFDIYEKEYPDADRPRKAIEATKKYIKNPSDDNKKAAAYAAEAAYSAYAAAEATYAAYSAYAAAEAIVADAAYAAYSAYSAYAAAEAIVAEATYSAYSAYAAADAAYDDAYAAYAADTAYSADEAGKLTIIKYGMELIRI